MNTDTASTFIVRLRQKHAVISKKVLHGSYIFNGRQINLLIKKLFNLKDFVLRRRNKRSITFNLFNMRKKVFVKGL